MSISWTLIIDLGIISLALLLATFLRAKVPFFQRYLIPNALTAGFILLPFYNYVFPLLGLGKAGLESLVFHLLNLSFVAMALKEGSMKGSGKRIYAMNDFITPRIVQNPEDARKIEAEKTEYMRTIQEGTIRNTPNRKKEDNEQE